MIKSLLETDEPGFADSYSLIFASLLFFISTALQAFNPGFPASRYLHRSWTASNGLPQSTVYAILQTRDHFLWIATDGGLARFDGVKFTLFNRSNTIGFNTNSVTTLCEDSKGGVWIGTYGGGVLHYNQGEFTHFDQRHGLSSLKIWSLLEDARGRLWIGTVGGGLNLLENGRVVRIWNRENGLPDDHVMTVVEDANASLWIGTRQGLCQIKDNRVKNFTTAQGLAGDSLVKLYIDQNGTLWAATTSGLSRKNGERFEMVSTEPAFSGTFVRSFSEDSQGRLFLGTENGLFFFNAGQPQKIAAGSLLSDQSLMALYCDREDNLWLGTSAGGLNILQVSSMMVYTTAQGMTGNRVLALLQDSSGNVWAGTNGQGLNRFNGSLWKPFPLLSKTRGISVYALLEDNQKRLWIGTAGNGLLLLANDKIRVFKEEDGLVADSIYSLAQGPDGFIWIGTSAGLFVFRYGRIESLAHSEPLANPVFSLAFDSQGWLYGGALGPRLFTYFAGKWKNYGAQHGLEGRMVFAVYPHPDGTFWAGTENGLFRQSGAKFIPCQFINAPSDIQVFGMVADNEHRLWLSTNKGPGCIEAGALAMVPVSGKITLPVHFFGEAEGMKSTVCSGGFQPTVWKGTAGRLWFSTQNGVVALKPREALIERSAIDTLIEGGTADGRNFAPMQLNSLPAGIRRLEIFFTAPFFSAPHQLSFKYRLQGFDREWQLTNNRSAVYNDLPPGRYRFNLLPMLNGKLGKGAVPSSLLVMLPKARFFPFWYALAIFLIVGLLGVGLFAKRLHQAGPAKKAAKYLLSNLASAQAAAYQKKLSECMRNDKPYLDPELTLAMLADKLSLPAKHLSQIINEYFGQNFNDFVNAYRIRAAIAMLSAAKTREDKLLKIAFESGFNSKSAFNAAFKKNTGFSPSEFRQRLAAK
jgi:ligand-binding sensor domain-containing protein/AraC-like DNA-binding protein